MEYIVHTRFKGLAICGEVNLRAFTELEEIDGVIFHGDKPLCVSTSENAHKHFTCNDDGYGMERGELTRRIQNTLHKHTDRWEKVWDSPMCQKYKRTDHADHWLWNHDFFNAPIEDLREIAKMIMEV